MTPLLRLLALLALLLCATLPVSAHASDLTDRLEALALQGNPEALYHLGMIHHVGLEGVARDPRRAFDYFRRAAEAGDPLGAYKVGCFYAGQGDGVVAADTAHALRYKLIAAEAGYDLAQVNVAQIFDERGETDRALRWLEAAARQGNSQGTGGAMVYRSREGLRPDAALALLYFDLLRRDMAEMIAGLPAELERPDLDAAMAPIRQHAEAGASAADRARASELIAQWRVERSAVSLRADLGLNAARRLVGLPDAA